MPDARDIAFRTVAEIIRCGGEAELCNIVQQGITQLGFIGFTCSSFRRVGQLASHGVEFSTMPSDFVTAFNVENLFPHDPVTRRANRETEPFFWSREDYDPLNDSHRRIERLRREVGVKGGMCCLLRERMGGLGSGGLFLNASGAAHRSVIGTRTALQVILGQIYLKLGDLRASTAGIAAADETGTSQPGDLTDREKTVMGWIAAGKSSWEVGRILSISEHTVNTHIERVVSKLAAANRAEAVAKAIVLNQLGKIA
jgi:DNA-binding CsgD family transcriptional regulator